MIYDQETLSKTNSAPLTGTDKLGSLTAAGGFISTLAGAVLEKVPLEVGGIFAMAAGLVILASGGSAERHPTVD